MYDSLLEENRELRDSNKYLREKLKEAYKEQSKFDEGRKGSAYLNLLKPWKELLVKSVAQQDEINYLTRELGKTKMKK